jgi:hypothetical protein
MIPCCQVDRMGEVAELSRRVACGPPLRWGDPTGGGEGDVRGGAGLAVELVPLPASWQGWEKHACPTSSGVFLWRVEGGLRTPFLWKRVRSPRCTVWEGDRGAIKE